MDGREKETSVGTGGDKATVLFIKERERLMFLVREGRNIYMKERKRKKEEEREGNIFVFSFKINSGCPSQTQCL